MVKRPMTFGRAIVAARKAKGLSQKDLAALIHKEDDECSISPQYLNDIEHDRRSPTSDHLIRQFAQVLGEDEGYMFVLAGKMPQEIREKAGEQDRRDQVVKTFAHFRRTITKSD
jgi:transcriptional regulator with XRE-family HTH domain